MCVYVCIYIYIYIKKVENIVVIILDKDKLVHESYMMGRHQTSPSSGLYFNLYRRRYLLLRRVTFNTFNGRMCVVHVCM